MLTDAIISGSLGRALYRDRDGVWVLDSSAPEPRVAEPNDLSAFRDIAREVTLADPDGLPTSAELLRSRLEEEVNFFHGLDCLLVGMDAEFSEDLRHEAIRNAERILAADGALAKRVRARFLIPANSQEWDPGGARHLAESIDAAHAADTYRPLADGTVDRIVDDLNYLIGIHFGSGVEAQSRRSAFLGSGLVAELCDASEDRSKLLGLPFRIHEFPQIRKIDPGGKVLTGLVKHLAASSEGIAPIEASAGDDSLEGSEGQSDTLVTAVLRAAEIQSERKRKGYRPLDHDLDAIQREIAWIGDRLRRGEIARAEAALTHLILDQASRSRPEDIMKSLTAVADQARRSRQFEFALRLLDAADFLEARDAAIMCVRGELLRELGRTDEALAMFRETMERFPQNEVAPTAYAGLLRELGRTDEALAMFRETMERFPQNEVAPTAYAGLLGELGRTDEALAKFRETMERFPQSDVAPTAYAELLRELGRTDEALAMFRETMERFPQNDVARNGYAELLRELGRTDEALAMFRETMERFPQSDVSPTAYAGLLRELGRTDEALAMFRETVERFPQSDVAPTAYAELLRELGRTDEALAMFRETMERFPQNDVTRNGYAELLRELGRTDEALAMFRETVEHFPHDEVARNGYAELLRELGRTDEALAMFRETMERFPQNEVARNGYAELLRELGRTDAALAMFRETMERFPQREVARNGYAELLRELGRTHEAQAMFRETMERFPQNDVTRNGYAELLRELGRTDEALAMFRETMERFPHDDVTRNSYANLLITEGEVNEGEALLAAATQRLQRRNDWIALHIVAMGNLRRRSPVIALEMLRRGRNECPYPDVAPYFKSALAMALIMDRRADEALVELEPLTEKVVSMPQTATIRLVKAHALGECGESEATQDEVSTVREQFVLSPKQRELAEMLLARYVRTPHAFELSALAAENDNIYRAEFELMTRVIRQGSVALARAA